MRRSASAGYIFRPKYRDKKTGQEKVSAVWWISYSHKGVRYRESSKLEGRQAAKEFLKERIGRAGLGKPVTPAIRGTTLDDLFRLVIADYTDNQYDTLARQEDAFNWLRAFFGADCPAEEIGPRLPEYRIWRRQQPDRRSLKRKGHHAQPPRIGCSVATLNRELSALRHAFALASQHNPPLVANVPVIKLAKERNRRKGFFEWEQFVRVRDHLPDYLKPVMTVAFFTGWRAASEICTRQPKHVVDDMLVLEADETKNEEPRKFPLDIIPELRDVVELQLAAAHRRALETGQVNQWLFPGRHGARIVDYLPAWHAACAAAGLSGRIPHDFRRSAARNLIGAGVDPLTTMQLVGWEDISMLKRYNIIDDETLKRGVAKLRNYLDAQKQKRAKVVAIRG